MATEWECLKGLGKTKKPKNKKVGWRWINYRFKDSADYKRYTKSSWWKHRRKVFWETHRRICFCCGLKATEIHHCSYKRVGHEKDKDLVPLCRDCHMEVTDMVFREEATLLEAHTVLKSIIALKI